SRAGCARGRRSGARATALTFWQPRVGAADDLTPRLPDEPRSTRYTACMQSCRSLGFGPLIATSYRSVRYSFPIAIALTLSSSASAQTITLLVNQTNQVVVSSGQCDNTLRVFWNASTFTGWCGDLQIWVTAGECGDAPVTGDTPQRTFSFSATDRNFDFLVKDLPIFKQADGGAVCGDRTINQVHKVCAAARFGGSFGGCVTTTPVTHASN